MNIEDKLRELAVEFETIEMIMLFGSYARKDFDAHSDIDIFILISDCKLKDYIRQKNDIAEYLGFPINYISLYTQEGFTALKNKGSYFLWHLKLEGILIYDKYDNYTNLFGNLEKYTSAKKDLLEYKLICEDIINNIRVYDEDSEYDLSVLASLIRNTCISICYCKGNYLFDRINPVLAVKKLMGESFPFSKNEYLNMYDFRLNRTRELSRELIKISNDDIINYAKRTYEIIDYGLHIIDKEVKKND